MDPIETLMREHERIVSVLQTLRHWARDLGQPAADERDTLAAYAGFLREYVDTIHHGKEEALLFAKMAERGFPKHVGPLAVMLAEHAEGRGLTEKLSVLAGSPLAWTTAEREDARRCVLAYASLLEGHIEKEDEILYPMARDRLADDDLEELSIRFDEFERNPTHRAMRDGWLTWSARVCGHE